MMADSSLTGDKPHILSFSLSRKKLLQRSLYNVVCIQSLIRLLASPLRSLCSTIFKSVEHVVYSVIHCCCKLPTPMYPPFLSLNFHSFLSNFRLLFFCLLQRSCRLLFKVKSMSQSSWFFVRFFLIRTLLGNRAIHHHSKTGMAWRIRFVWAAPASGCLHLGFRPLSLLALMYMYKCTLHSASGNRILNGSIIAKSGSLKVHPKKKKESGKTVTNVVIVSLLISFSSWRSRNVFTTILMVACF